MRLQLIHRSVGLALAWLLGVTALYGQANPDSLKPQDPVEIDFLLNYYEQDGDHAAVTGGIGTQELTDQAGKLIVNVPLDSVSRLEITTGLNVYSSASTDRIDAYLSTASAKDARFRQYYRYSRENPAKGKAFSIQVGGSIESDYLSRSIDLSFAKSSPDQNRELSINLGAYLDTWIIILPEELRDSYPVWMRTDRRNSFNLGVTWSQVLSPRLQGSIQAGLVFQYGLLSTPFHRTYFQGMSLPKVERFPGQRWKVPLALRLHYFAGDRLILRGYYRWYWDSFEIMAHTASLEISWKVSPFISLYPFYRFHTQTAAYFFKSYGEHVLTDTYYSSDWDLAGLNSQKLGLGLHFAPLKGQIGKNFSVLKRRPFFKSLDLRGARYVRSDGLEAWLLSLHAAFLFH